MNIEKAIEILTHMSHSSNVASLEDCLDAIKLGIEALKRIGQFLEDNELLPGETTE